MGEVDSRNALVFPYPTETHFIVKQAQLFNYVVHYQVNVYLWLVSNALLIRYTELAHLANVKSLIWIQF